MAECGCAHKGERYEQRPPQEDWVGRWMMSRFSSVGKFGDGLLIQGFVRERF